MKKEVIIWANCQGGSVNYMLNKYYSHLFNIKSYMNYEYIRNTEKLPYDFKSTDIFIYQNYSDKPGSEYDLSYILNDVLKKECIKICIPFLQFDAIFCYDSHSPLNNYKTISKKYPFGKFFFGINIVNKYIELNTLSSNEIIDKCLDYNAINEEQIKYYYNRSFEYLEKKILSSDVPELFDYIKNNFTKIRLFHNRNHPTGIMLNELIKYIFKLLQLEYEDNEENIKILDTLNDWVMPILPSVKLYYNCTFEDICSSWYHPNIIDNKTFIEQYIKDYTQ